MIASVNDYFSIFSIPRSFRDEDAALLERRFHELQRRYHPDHSASNESIAEVDMLDHSSKINEAYRTLREPIARTKYLLSLYGYSVERAKQVPMDLLELVMTVQEYVAQMQAGVKLGNELSEIESDLNARILSSRAEIENFRIVWDSESSHTEPGIPIRDDEKNIIESLAQALATRAYLQTLYDTLRAAKEGKTLVLRH